MLLVLDHDTVRADVYRAGVGIFGDYAAAGADICAAVAVVPFRYGKLVEIDIGFAHLIFKHRAAFASFDRNGLVSRASFSPGVKIIDAVFFVDAHRRAGSPARAKHVRGHAKTIRVAFEVSEKQRGTFFLGESLCERNYV